MISLQRLRYFVAVAEDLHFTRAARRLYVDQGALSNAIRRLERDLGAPLFIRSSRRVELTALGRSLLPEVVDLLQRADRLESGVEAQARRGAAAQALRIGLLGAPGPALSEILRLLQISAPNLKATVREIGRSDFSAGFANRTLDAVFMFCSPRPSADYRIIPLWENDYGIAVSRRHELADAATLSVQDIVEHRFRPLELGEDATQYATVTLHATRDRAAPTCAAWDPTRTVYEEAFQGGRRSDVVMGTNAVLRSLRPVENFGLTYVPVIDAPRSVTSLVVGESCGHRVESLVRAARTVAAGISGIIPGAWPHPELRRSGVAAHGDLIRL